MTESTGDRIVIGNLTADGSTTGKVIKFRGDFADIEVTGTFGGAAITFQRLGSDGSTWIDERDESGTVVSITQNEIVRISIPYSVTLRATAAGTTTTDIDVSIKRVRRGS